MFYMVIELYSELFVCWFFQLSLVLFHSFVLFSGCCCILFCFIIFDSNCYYCCPVGSLSFLCVFRSVHVIAKSFVLLFSTFFGY